MTKRYVFDSHSFLAFFQKEDGAETVARILEKAIAQQMDRFICLINLGEIIYITKRNFGDIKKLEVLARINQLGVKVLPVEEALVFKAAEIKAEYPISYADCFALACAQEQAAALVTGDPDFKKVEHLVDIHWIR